MFRPQRSGGRDRRALLLAALAGALASAVVALLVAPPLLLTQRQEIPFERTYAAAVVDLVSRIGGGDAVNPVANDPRALTVGRVAYTGSCALCHGAVGDGRGSFGPSTYPGAADLTAPKTASKSDAQLFWITKHGLGFTAMPGFSQTLRDEEIWALVAYMRALQRGRAEPIPVPPPTATDLAQADPFGDAAARGAAVFYAQGCHRCHGPEANAPGELAIRGRIGTQIVRTGDPRGMPRFGPERISDAQLADLEAFLRRFAEEERLYAGSGSSSTRR